MARSIVAERSPKGRNILIISFVLIKALVLFSLWAGLDFSGNIQASNQVYAKEDGEPNMGGRAELGDEIGTSQPTIPEDLFLSIQRERDALRKREESLSKREEHVRQEEARFKKIQGEIEERLEALVEIQTSIQELIQEKKGLEDTILKKLAKVYESTPPEQAGPMISELDVKLAAQILIRMDGRKAGKIWGYVSPERASQISSEIANLQ